MRLLLAGVFVFASFLAGVLTLSSVYGKGPWPWWATALPLVAGAGSMLISMFLFNRPGQRPTLRARTLDEVIAELDSKGLILRQRFQAKRAFVVEEYEDEGPHYYLELEDGGVLHLTGQHLYDLRTERGRNRTAALVPVHRVHHSEPQGRRPRPSHRVLRGPHRTRAAGSDVHEAGPRAWSAGGAGGHP